MGIIRYLFSIKIDHYDSIETMPIYNWFKINETNDLTWLIKGKKIEVKDQSFLFKAWDKMSDEFFDTFGIPEKMVEVLELKRDIFVLQCELQISGDRINETFIEIRQQELNELLNTTKKESTGQVKVYVEKYLGRHLDLKVITVKEFYEYIEAMKSEQRQANGR